MTVIKNVEGIYTLPEISLAVIYAPGIVGCVCVCVGYSINTIHNSREKKWSYPMGNWLTGIRADQ